MIVEGALTQTELKKILNYNPATGIFTRKIGGRGIRYGETVGTKNTKGYLFTGHGGRINNRKYSLHRLAWLYMTGEWPKNQIDHMNGVKDDNRWINLRQATNSQNHFNRPRQKNNNTGFKGIWIDPRNTHSPFIAEITSNGKRIHIGSFSSAEEAHQAYCLAAAKYHGEFRRTA